MTTRTATPPTTLEALLPVLALAAMVTAGVFTIGFGGDLLVLSLLGSAFVAGVIAVRRGAGEPGGRFRSQRERSSRACFPSS
jgi:hypothetical protein